MDAFDSVVTTLRASRRDRQRLVLRIWRFGSRLRSCAEALSANDGREVMGECSVGRCSAACTTSTHALLDRIAVRTLRLGVRWQTRGTLV